MAGAGPAYKRGVELDEDACYRAVASRDRRFEGRFVVAVRTTRVYCRPGCPAPLPRRRNSRFFACAAAAEAAGFRPCRRCRPDASPGTPAWSGTSATVSRALRLIEEGRLDGRGVEGLAESLGVTSRHLRRLFAERLGVAPAAIGRTRRAHFARQLLDQGGLAVTEVALGAGYGSLRAFDRAFRHAFGASPGEVRGRKDAGPEAPGVVLRLAYRPPLDWAGLAGFLGERAIPGVEEVADGTYRRSVRVGDRRGTIAVRPGAGPWLELRVALDGRADLLPVAERVRRLFDLGADPAAIAGQLGPDPVLGPLLRARPGLRVPGAWDPFELAVRAVLGQQVSVKAARTLAARLVEARGERLTHPGGALTRLFPTATSLAGAGLAGIGLTAARARAVTALARAVDRGELALGTPESLDRAVARLSALPGFGDWTAHYVALRALGEPDAFPAGDLGVRKALAGGGALPTPAQARARAEAWRPWRAYAVLALWLGAPDEFPAAPEGSPR